VASAFQGNGLRYKLVLRPEEKWDGVGYTTSFDTQPGGEWQTICIPFSEFIPVFRAKSIKVGGGDRGGRLDGWPGGRVVCVHVCICLVGH